MLQQSLVSKALSPFYPLLRDLVVDGFHDYPREYGHVSFKHHARTRACVISDHIAAYAKERLQAHSQFRHIPTKIRNLFDFDGSFIVQFKKLSRRLRTSNIQTKFSWDFDRQHTIALPGIPPTLPRLTVGYIARRDWTAIDGVFLTYSSGKSLVWFEDLTNAGQAEQLPIISADHEQPATKRVRARASRRKQGGDSAAAL